MSYYNQGYGQPPAQPNAAQNLQFFSSSYPSVSGHTTPSQASYGGYGAASAAPTYPTYGNGPASGAFGGAQGVSGRMGEQGGLRTGWLAAFGTEGYDGEPSLMEELGVNFGHIKMKTLAVLNPWVRPSPHIMDDSDLYGSVFYIFLFGFFNALSGKSLFSYVYGISAFGGSGLHWIFALMSPVADPSEQDQMSQAQRDHQAHQGGHFSTTLTIFRSLSVLGYCFLPLTFISALGVAIPMDSLMGYALTAAAVGWATYSASGIFVSVGRMVGMRGLVAYPLALFYLGFGIMVIFSSKGSGVLQVKIM